MQPESHLKDIIPVILAGGQGRRLRPLTSSRTPKPFLRLLSPHTFLQKTVLRVHSLNAPALVANVAYRDRIKKDMAALGVTPSQIFLEPEGRQTAPAVAVAAHYFAATGNDPLLLVMPSDHAIENPDMLLDAVRHAEPVARQGKMVSFGVRPIRPETEYGYIRQGKQIQEGVFSVSSFIEKPDVATAKDFIQSGDCYWNSGIFLFSVSCFLAQLKQFNSVMCDQSYAAVARASRLQNAVFLEKEAFSSCPAESLDRAVMEKTDSLAVMPIDVGWRDLGRWPDLFRYVLRAA